MPASKKSFLHLILSNKNRIHHFFGRPGELVSKYVHDEKPNFKGPITKLGLCFKVNQSAILVYILQNATTGKLYKGQTADLESRIERHNTHEPGSMRYTYKQKGVWHLIYSQEHSTRSEAMKREIFLKSGQGREWIKTNILNH